MPIPRSFSTRPVLWAEHHVDHPVHLKVRTQQDRPAAAMTQSIVVRSIANVNTYFTLIGSRESGVFPGNVVPVFGCDSCSWTVRTAEWTGCQFTGLSIDLLSTPLNLEELSAAGTVTGFTGSSCLRLPQVVVVISASAEPIITVLNCSGVSFLCFQ